MTDSITNPKKHLLRELYPYNIKDKKNAALRKGLKEYAFLLQALTAAAQNFLDGKSSTHWLVKMHVKLEPLKLLFCRQKRIQNLNM
jgi:hypothetical protein